MVALTGRSIADVDQSQHQATFYYKAAKGIALAKCKITPE